MDPSKYDPNAIMLAAEAKREQQDLHGAHMMFESALLDWADDAREGSIDPDQMKEAIATLWLGYADFHKTSKMFRTCMETYEKAVSDPVASSVGRVWLEYARFAEERDKPRTAQNVYLRALVGPPPAVTDEQDATLLWEEFLALMRTSNQNPSLTMNELRNAVEQEHLAILHAAPEPVTSHGDEGRPEKKLRLESPQQHLLSNTYAVTKEAVEAETAGLLGLTTELPPEMLAAWIARDGDAPAVPPEPPLFSPSPPKLSDPTGRDLLGSELALAVIERLLESSGSVMLETCRGLWMLTALKEKEATTAIDKLDKELNMDMGQLEANLEARLSVAGAAATAIEQMNEGERTAFQQACVLRRQQLLSYLAWEFRKLLCIQQNILTQLKVPAFDGPNPDAQTLDLQSRVCSFLHSAFYIRAKVGVSGHMTMLKSQAERLKRDMLNRSPPRSPIPHHTTMMPPPPNYPIYGEHSNMMMYPHLGSGIPPTGYPPNLGMPPIIQTQQMMHHGSTNNPYLQHQQPPYYH